MKKIGLIALLIVCSTIIAGSIAFAVSAAPAVKNQTIVETVAKEETTELEETTTEPVEEETAVVIEEKETIVDKFLDIEYIDSMDLRRINDELIPQCSIYITELQKYWVDEKWIDEVDLISAELIRVNEIKNKYIDRVDYLEKLAEYPEATKIWYYLRNKLGYSEEVSAGILGNIMAEAGGQTLNIDVDVVNAYAGHYGICQWSTYYYPEVYGASLDGQLDYLGKTIEYQINAFGGIYYYGFNYQRFLQINSAEEAALSFALTYERCGGNSYGIRQANAITAYNYFTN
jgi:hypothetical protein